MKIALSIPGFGQIDSGLPVPTTTGQSVIWTLLNLVLVVAVLVALYFIIKGGLSIIMSEGQKEKLSNARKEVFHAVLGLIIIFMSFLVINAIGALLGINLLALPFK